MCLFSVLDKIKIVLMATSDLKNRILAPDIGFCVHDRYLTASPSFWAKQIYSMLAAHLQASEEMQKGKYKTSHKENTKPFKLRNIFFLQSSNILRDRISSPDLTQMTEHQHPTQVCISPIHTKKVKFSWLRVSVLEIWKTKVISGTNFYGLWYFTSFFSQFPHYVLKRVPKCHCHCEASQIRTCMNNCANGKHWPNIISKGQTECYMWT